MKGIAEGASALLRFTRRALGLVLVVSASSRAPEARAGDWPIAGRYKGIPGDTIYVAPDGVYGARGTVGEPTTLEGARDRIRALQKRPAGGVLVYLRGGVYRRDSTFALSGPRDSGTPDSPIIYGAFPGETVRLVGGILVQRSDFSLVAPSSPVWQRLDPASRGHVWEVDLSRYTTDYGTLESRSPDRGESNRSLELFYGDVPMELARYPDKVDARAVSDDYAQVRVTGSLTPDATGVYTRQAGGFGGFPLFRMVKGGSTWSLYFYRSGINRYYLGDPPWLGGKNTGYWYAGFDGVSVLGTYTASPPSTTGQPFVEPVGRDPYPGFLVTGRVASDSSFSYEGERARRWASARDVYAMGYWGAIWDSRHVRLLNVDTVAHLLVTSGHPHRTVRGQPYFVYNVLEELSSAGEWYLDRANGRLYFWPPDSAFARDAYVSTLQAALVSLANVSHVRLEGMTFEIGRGNLIAIRGGTGDQLAQCRIRNAGGYGIVLSGTSNGIERCEIAYTGRSSVVLYGGDRETLTPGNNFVRNCDIHNFGRLFWTSEPAVDLKDLDDSSVAQTHNTGNLVEHNSIHHGPFAAVYLRGNNHTVRYNDIYDVVEWTSDMGAVYVGRDWGSRGNQIEFNFIHDVQSPLGAETHGVYVDDCASGVTVVGNVLYRVAAGAALLHGGGRDVVMRNNILVGNAYGLQTDNRGTRFITNVPGSGWNLLERIERFHYRADPWASMYPALAALPDDWETLQHARSGLWLYPEGSVFSCNVNLSSVDLIAATTAGTGPTTLSAFADTTRNLNGVDPMFVNLAGFDLALQPGSPVYQRLPCFQPIPFGRIGVEPTSAPLH